MSTLADIQALRTRAKALLERLDALYEQMEPSATRLTIGDAKSLARWVLDALDGAVSKAGAEAIVRRSVQRKKARAGK